MIRFLVRAVVSLMIIMTMYAVGVIIGQSLAMIFK